jgi:hypothetical protein
VSQNRATGTYSGIVSERNGMGTVRISDNRITGSQRSNAVNVGTCFNDSGNGITVIQESGTELVLNHLADNARFGIEVTASASNTTVDQNRTVRGTQNDLVNSGMGSTVSMNTCRTSQPAGLCAFTP